MIIPILVYMPTTIADVQIPSKDLVEKIKDELTTLEEGREPIVHGISNPDFRGEDPYRWVYPKHIDGYNWGFVEDSSEKHYAFLLLGTPAMCIRLMRRCGGMPYDTYNSHNASIAIRFDTTIFDDGLARTHQVFVFYNFTEAITPFNNGTDTESLHVSYIQLYGLPPEGRRTSLINSIDGVTTPLSYLSEIQRIEFFRVLSDDLRKASPSAARFVNERFGL